MTALTLNDRAAAKKALGAARMKLVDRPGCLVVITSDAPRAPENLPRPKPGKPLFVSHICQGATLEIIAPPIVAHPTLCLRGIRFDPHTLAHTKEIACRLGVYLVDANSKGPRRLHDLFAGVVASSGIEVTAATFELLPAPAGVLEQGAAQLVFLWMPGTFPRVNGIAASMLMKDSSSRKVTAP